jgi:hypothetical protein
MSTSSTPLEHETHELALHIRVGRARACALILILADALSILAILAAGGYLRSLNTENLYRSTADHPPAFVPGLVVAIVLVLSGLAYYWWERSVRQKGSSLENIQQVFFILALVFMIVAMVVQIVISVTLNRGYTTPYDAYKSVITLLMWSMAVRHFLGFTLGLLLLGRIMRGRLAGREYLAEAAGYWWYYTVIASLLMWLFALLVA